MVRFRLLCGDFLLPNPAPHLENRMTVCMGYTAMTPQGRAGKRRWKGAGKPCRENGAPNINWSKWPVDVVNDTKRHSPEKPSALRLTSCGQFVYMRYRHRKACWLAALRQDPERHRHEVYPAPDGKIRHFQREEN